MKKLILAYAILSTTATWAAAPLVCTASHGRFGSIGGPTTGPQPLVWHSTSPGYPDNAELILDLPGYRAKLEGTRRTEFQRLDFIVEDLATHKIYNTGSVSSAPQTELHFSIDLPGSDVLMIICNANGG